MKVKGEAEADMEVEPNTIGPNSKYQFQKLKVGYFLFH